MILEADKIGSATSPLKLAKTVSVIYENDVPKAGDVVAGSVTDSQMGEDFVQSQYNINAGNARRNGKRLFALIDFAKREKSAFA